MVKAGPTTYILAVLSLFTICNFEIFSQNLVKNPDFEIPFLGDIEGTELTSLSYIRSLGAESWFSLNNGTPDYLTRIDSLQDYSVSILNKSFPLLFVENHVFNENGAIGLSIYTLGGTLEHITGSLIEPLNRDSIYTLSLNIYLSNFSYIYLKEIEVLFSEEFPSELMVMDNFYEVLFKTPLSSDMRICIPSTSQDSAIRISKDFMANGGEKYVTIGMFFREDIDLLPIIDRYRWIDSKGRKYERKTLKRDSETSIYGKNCNYISDSTINDRLAYYILDDISLCRSRRD